MINNKHNNYLPNQHDYLKDNQWQVKNIVTNQEILQHKQLTAHRKANLANNDFSCMMKKD